MKRDEFKTTAYLAITLASVIIVLTTAYLILRTIDPGFTLVGLRRSEGKGTLALIGMLAFGTVVATTWILRRFCRGWFGETLDDPDAVEASARPALEKSCLRCGAFFGVFRNDFHAAGFCSRACQDVHARSKRS